MRGLLIVCVILAGCSGAEPRRAAAPVAASTAATGTKQAAPTLATSPTPPTVPAQPSIRGFKPSVHGFAFVNDFQGSPLPFASNLPTRFGLCGGMSYAAADYFIAKREVPADTTPPKEGTPLYKYLYKRQAASIGPMGAMGLKFMEWMRLTDAETHARTLVELPAITRALARDEPVVLGLVYVSSKQTLEPWHNHQVLAYAARAEGGITELLIYDPNYPRRDDVVIRVSSGEETTITEVVPGRRVINVRGVFRMGYVAVGPG